MLNTLTNLIFGKSTPKGSSPVHSAPAEVRSIVPPKTIQPVIDPTPITQPGPRHEGEPVPYYPRKGPAVPCVTPAKILQTQDALIRELRQASALSFDDFDTYMLPAIVQFAEFVHLLPASEYDHHSDLGGLFRHGLEVALNASRRSEGKEFALNEVPSIRKFQIFRWRACAMLGGMLHDLGKAVIDVGAMEVNGDRVWNPHVQSLWSWLKEHKIEYYTIAWREDRRHKEHDAISATALLRILPDETMRWLGEYRGRVAYDAMLMALTGSNDRNNPLIDIIKGADGDSVAKDRAESQKRLASIGEAGSRSHAAQVVRAMRELILKGKWQVNQLGHLVWHTKQGVYILYPQFAKEAIEHLRGQSISSIPNEPALILAMLRETGVAGPMTLPNGESYDLHKVVIHAKDKSGEKVSFEVTAIKLLNDRFIPDLVALPEPVDVDICNPDGKVLQAAAAPEAQSPDAAASQPPVAGGAKTAKPTTGKPRGKTTAPTPAPAPAPAPVEQVAKHADAPPPARFSDDDHPELPDISDEDMEAINSGMLDTDPFAQSSTDAPLRDWGSERDARTATIEDNLEISRSPFPPTTADGAFHWLERQPNGVYIQFLIDQAKKGVLKWGTDIFVVDDLFLLRYPLALEGCGVDPADVLDIFNNEGWLQLDSVRPNKKVIPHSLGLAGDIQTVRFSHGMSVLLSLTLPPAPASATTDQVPDVGPFITGRRAALWRNPPNQQVRDTIVRAAMYDYFVHHYPDTQPSLRELSREELGKHANEFSKRHSIPIKGLLNSLARGETPLAKDVAMTGEFTYVDTYDRGFDETLIHREL